KRFPRRLLVSSEPGMMADDEGAYPIHHDPRDEDQSEIQVRSAIDAIKGDHACARFRSRPETLRTMRCPAQHRMLPRNVSAVAPTTSTSRTGSRTPSPSP